MINFHLTESAWQAAEQYLQGKPSGTKYEKVARDLLTGEKDRNNKRSLHSFVIIKDVIYALGDVVDEGGSSIVKQGLTKDGVLVAIKIDASALDDEKSDAYQAATKNKLLIGQGLRKAINMRIKFKNPAKNITTDQKRYTVMQWRGKSLMSQIESSDTLTSTQKRMLGLRICLLVEALHEQGIIHADLKAENIMANISGNDIKVDIVDFDYVKILKSGMSFVETNISSGSICFISPEILIKKRYSVLSDCFALAVILLYQIDITCNGVPYLYYNSYYDAAAKNLKVSFYPLAWLMKKAPNLVIDDKLREALAGMLAYDVNRRTDYSKLVLYLCDKLEHDASLEDELKTQVREIRAQAVLKQFKDKPVVESVLPIATVPLITYSPQTTADVNTKEQIGTISPSKKARLM